MCIFAQQLKHKHYEQIQFTAEFLQSINAKKN